MSLFIGSTLDRTLLLPGRVAGLRKRNALRPNTIVEFRTGLANCSLESDVRRAPTGIGSARTLVIILLRGNSWPAVPSVRPRRTGCRQVLAFLLLQLAPLNTVVYYCLLRGNRLRAALRFDRDGPILCAPDAVIRDSRRPARTAPGEEKRNWRVSRVIAARRIICAGRRWYSLELLLGVDVTHSVVRARISCLCIVGYFYCAIYRNTFPSDEGK